MKIISKPSPIDARSSSRLPSYRDRFYCFECLIFICWLHLVGFCMGYLSSLVQPSLELLYCRHLDQTALRLLGRPMFDLMATEVSDLAVLCMIMKRRLEPLFTYSGDPMHP